MMLVAEGCSSVQNFLGYLFAMRKPMEKQICLSVKNPIKISVSLRPDLLADLKEMAEFEGRSLSNLCAFLLEQSYKNAAEQKQ